MNEWVEQVRKDADQHNRLGSCDIPFYEVVLLREDVLVKSGADPICLERLHKECYICGIIADNELSRADVSWILTHLSSPRCSMKFPSVITSGGSTAGSSRVLSNL
jgi:hypothetical protein